MILFRYWFTRKDVFCLSIIGIVYVSFYSWILVASDGLPYVMDSNETFSAWWHAYNLLYFDLTKSAGLADESFAFHAAAHPYVHTHQGNFPRLYALLLLVLGVESVESQIAVTTFTVGVVAVFMAYHFFSKIANPLCALVFCLLLITDYVLVAQWQVVTYRVWHGFFVFSSMLCVHRMVEGRRFWTVITVINFSCLFYYELVFVAFVALSSAIYAAFLCRHAPGKVLGFWALQVLGGFMALCVLVLQLYLYLGWDGLKTDLYLTFVARNQYQDSAALLQHMQEFFEPRNIVFWYNLADGAAFRTIGEFFASLLHFELQVRTPFLFLLFLIGALALFVVPRFRPSVFGPGKAPAGSGIHGAIWHDGFQSRIAVATTGFSFLAFLALFFTLLGKDSILGAPAEIKDWFLPADSGYFGMALIAAFFASELLRRACRKQHSGSEARLSQTVNQIDLGAMLRVSVFVLLVAVIAAGNWLLFDPRYAPLWRDFADQYLPGPLPQIVILLMVMLASVAMIAKNEFFREPETVRVIRGCGKFFLAGMAAYTVVYLLSPGYVFTGYRFRHVPFTVFHTTVVPALLMYVLLATGLKYLPSGRLRKAVDAMSLSEDAVAMPRFRWMSMRAVVVVTSLTTFSLLVFYWGGVQFSYARLMPPDHYSFLQKLPKPPYVGKTFLVNTYTAPIAAKTGAWAYLNVNLKSTEPLPSEGYEFPFDTTYLWFADKKTNPDYAHPEYFLCVTMQSISTVLQETLRKNGLGDSPPGCEQNPLVQLVRRGKGKSFYPGLELLEADRDGVNVVGYERWAIVKLNWKQ